MRKIEFLNHLSDYEVAKIAHVAWTEHHKKGDYIVKEGDEGMVLSLLSRKLLRPNKL